MKQLAVAVDKNIPPPPDPCRGRPARYPYATMKVGESFKVPPDTRSPYSVAGNGNTFHKPKRFVVRYCEKRRCYCCWRIA
jgi:hypothetical protein